MADLSLLINDGIQNHLTARAAWQGGKVRLRTRMLLHRGDVDVALSERALPGRSTSLVDGVGIRQAGCGEGCHRRLRNLARELLLLYRGCRACRPASQAKSQHQPLASGRTGHASGRGPRGHTHKTEQQQHSASMQNDRRNRTTSGLTVTAHADSVLRNAARPPPTAHKEARSCCNKACR